MGQTPSGNTSGNKADSPQPHGAQGPVQETVNKGTNEYTGQPKQGVGQALEQVALSQGTQA